MDQSAVGRLTRFICYEEVYAMSAPSKDEKRLIAMFDSFCKTVVRNFSRNLKRAKENQKKYFSKTFRFAPLRCVLVM